MRTCTQNPAVCVCVRSVAREWAGAKPKRQNHKTAACVKNHTHPKTRSSVSHTTLLRIHYNYIQQQQRETNRERLHFDYILVAGVGAS